MYAYTVILSWDTIEALYGTLIKPTTNDSNENCHSFCRDNHSGIQEPYTESFQQDYDNYGKNTLDNQR